MKKLSICIPTYNRAHFLDVLLNSLVTQIIAAGCGDSVEILVSDNASPDDTPRVAEKYKGHIRYWRNTENIGPDANFLKLFGEASAEFIWLPGDDDTVREDTLRYILRMVDAHGFDYLYLRSRGVRHKGWQQRDATQVTSSKLLEKVNIFTTFMTSQVIRSSLIKPNIEAARVHLGGFMAYYWIFLQALAGSAKCLISEEKEVFPDETENTGGYRFYKVWAESVFDVMRVSSFGGDTNLFDIMRSRMFFALLLPVTYRFRSGASKFSFQNESPAIGLKKYFSAGIYKPIGAAYFSLPFAMLRPLNLLVRAYLRLSRDLRGDVF